MLARNDPDRIQIAFDDRRLVANAGLILPSTLALHLGLRELVDDHVDLGDAPGRANTGDKMLTLVASALAGGDCIDDADALRAGGTEQVLGCAIKAPSTLGTFLRSFRWGHVRQLDRVSRELLARAWAAGAGPGDDPFTIDLDSTVCETYGLAKEGAQRHNYAGQRGYHPILAVAAGTGEVLMCRLRQGRANTARGAAHFLRETVGRVRYAGATGPLTMRADSGFYTHDIVAACRDKSVRFSITVRQHQSVRNIIEAIPEAEWTPIPYWMEGAADVAETAYTPFGSEPDAVPVRLIVRRVKPTPGSQLALFATYSYHAFITDREGDTLDLEADHRRHAEIENAIRDLKYGVGLNHLPSGRFPANGAWLAVQIIAHNLARWTTRIGLGEALVTTKTCGDASSPWPDGSPARPAASPCTCPRAGPGKTNSAPPWRDYAPCHYPPDRPTASDPSARPPNCLADLRQAGSRVSPAAICPLISPVAGAAVRQHPLGVAITPCAQPDWSGSRPRRLDPAPLILPSLTVARPFRWIWANATECVKPRQLGAREPSVPLMSCWTTDSDMARLSVMSGLVASAAPRSAAFSSEDSFSPEGGVAIWTVTTIAMASLS